MEARKQATALLEKRRGHCHGQGSRSGAEGGHGGLQMGGAVSDEPRCEGAGGTSAAGAPRGDASADMLLDSGA